MMSKLSNERSALLPDPDEPNEIVDRDALADLGVTPEGIADIADKELRTQNTWMLRPQTHRQRIQRYRAKMAKRTAKMAALQPFTGMSTEEIMRAVGYTDKQIKNKGMVARSLTNSGAFVQELAKCGIGPERIAALIAAGIDGQVPLRGKYNEIVKDDEGNPIMVTDHTLRLAYIDRVMRISGADHVPEKGDGPPVSAIIINLMQKIEQLPPEKQAAVAEGDFSVLEEAVFEAVDESDGREKDEV
jgi:hypothetical protein